MADSPNAQTDGTPINERILDLLVFVPAGLAVSVVEELPKLAALGRERLGVRVSSARAVGHFAVKAGRDEFQRRSVDLFRKVPPGSPARSPERGGSSGRAAAGTGPTVPRRPPVGIKPPAANGHVPDVSTLSIPGFDTLSASQVVQRLDGLNRMELVSVRAYEASSRGRRTILSRVDQLLDERS